MDLKEKHAKKKKKSWRGNYSYETEEEVEREHTV